MLTMKTKYALKALGQLALAAPGEPMLIADIAEREDIPRKFLEAILVELKQHGFVRSRKGRGGGYTLAKNPDTGYQSMYRRGSHQSATRAWLKPTLMTESLVRRNAYGQTVGKGFAADIHCTTGAPREAFVKLTRAEAGGVDGVGEWRPVVLGFRPANENEALRNYIAGGFVRRKQS